MKLNINGKEIEVSNDDIKKALDEGVDTFELQADFVVRTTDEDNAFKENVRKEGLTIGTEIGRKELIKKLGIEGEGIHKSDDTAIEAINGFMSSKIEAAVKDAGKEPSAKVKELTKDLETLKGTISSLQQERDTFKSELVNTKNGYEKRSLLMSAIPDNTVLPKEDIIALVENKVNLQKTESGWVGIGADGQPIKDGTTLNPIPAQDIIKGFFNDNPQYLTKPTGGAGEGDSGNNGGKQSLESFTKEMQDKGYSLNGEEFNTEMQARIKAGTLDI